MNPEMKLITCEIWKYDCADGSSSMLLENQLWFPEGFNSLFDDKNVRFMINSNLTMHVLWRQIIE